MKILSITIIVETKAKENASDMNHPENQPTPGHHDSFDYLTMQPGSPRPLTGSARPGQVQVNAPDFSAKQYTYIMGFGLLLCLSALVVKITETQVWGGEFTLVLSTIAGFLLLIYGFVGKLVTD